MTLKIALCFFRSLSLLFSAALRTKIVDCFLFQMLMSVLLASVIRAVKITMGAFAASVIKDTDSYRTISV